MGQSEKTPRSLGRPVDLQKRHAILQAARTVFVENGFAGAAIELIAAHANVSKVTVYNQFGSKLGVLSALVETVSDQFVNATRKVQRDPGDIRDALVSVGMTMLDILFSRDHVALENAIAQAAARHEDFARQFFETGQQRFRDALAEILHGYGGLDVLDLPNSTVAADQLIGLFLGFEAVRRRYLPCDPMESDALRAHCERAVALFLRSYGRIDLTQR